MESTISDDASAPTLESKILCPECESELPSDLVHRLETQADALAPGRDGISSDTGGTASSAAPVLLAPPRSATRPVITTESLKQSVNESEEAENSAMSAAISADELRRWSLVAGVPIMLPTSAEPSPTGSEKPSAPGTSPAKSFPLLPPPPSSAKSATGSRFGFFSRGKGKATQDEDSDDDDPGGAMGYARIGGPASDDEGDDGYESDKPVYKPAAKKEADEPTSETVAKAPTVPETSIPTVQVEHPAIQSGEELRKLLTEVLARVSVLSTSHNELLSSHATLLTSLKIARSNLVMAEANTEMLEDELRRLKSAPQPSATPEPRTEQLKEPKPRPSSMVLPGVVVPTKSSGGFGFWKKSSTGGGSPTEDKAPNLPRAVSADGRHSRNASADMREDEVRQLREKLDNQSDELEQLKKGKKAIEQELEGLSQALFEEANKMVADERRRRAELEENLNEVKEEREALRQTVKVLGGRLATPGPGTPAAELTESEANGMLDEHYAALRRGIHHAVDGPSPAPSDIVSDAASDCASDVASVGSSEDGDERRGRLSDDTGRTRSNTVTTLKANGRDSKPTLESGLPPSPTPLATEPNPWD